MESGGATKDIDEVDGDAGEDAKDIKDENSGDDGGFESCSSPLFTSFFSRAL